MVRDVTVGVTSNEMPPEPHPSAVGDSEPGPHPAGVRRRGDPGGGRGRSRTVWERARGWVNVAGGEGGGLQMVVCAAVVGVL